MTWHGPVGQFAILSAYLQGGGRVIAVAGLEDRPARARAPHAEVVDFNAEDPVPAILDLSGGVGVDRQLQDREPGCLTVALHV